jgi:diguanylate cyclase (GGDEF)-like protein
MNVPLRVLIVEDSEDDMLLLLQALRNGGYDPVYQRVEEAKAMRQVLHSEPWELVITDHGLPQFDSAGALQAVKDSGLDIPVIIVSGTIGEEIAVEAMKAGAHDYVLKDNLVRLVPAITRSLHEAETRRAHKRAEAAIHHMAYHDALTGLVNRVEFEHRLQQALLSARERELQHALLYLDLDQFKLINDTCGHSAGDEMLRQLAIVLRTKVRNTDTLARLGGDEFGILLESCMPDHAYRIAESIRQAVQSFRFAWNNMPFTIAVSIGIVAITENSREIIDVLSAADIACYAAKDAGRNRIQLYHESDVELARRYGEMQWVTRINKALDQDRLVLYQQPIYLTGDTSLPFGNEFLLRMLDEQNHIVLPGAFIPAAERYNLMPALDRWVIRSVFSYIAALTGSSPANETPLSFINLSGASLSDEAFFNFIQEQMRT